MPSHKNPNKNQKGKMTMINVRTIKKMLDGDTLNIKNGKIKKYKGGFQVNVQTYEHDSPESAIFWAKLLNTLDGGCSIQFKNGNTTKASLEIITENEITDILNKLT